MSETDEDLRATIARLTAENEALRSAKGDRDAPPTGPPAAPPTRRSGLERSRWWTALATVLIVLGAVLAPAGLVSSWARTQLSDTDEFVSTFAPLAKDPAVRAFVTEEVTKAIDEQLNIKQLTSNVFDGIAGLGLGPRATDALKALEGPTVAGLRNLLHTTVDRFVSSQAFADLWAQLLRTSHTQLIKTMQGSSSAAVTIQQDGTIGLQLGPIIEAVKTQLVKQGLTFAAHIPTINRTIVLAKSDAATQAQAGYALAIGLGTWLPWVALALLVAGVLVARRRTIALVWAGVALALSMLLTLAGVGVGRIVVTQALASAVPRNAAQVIYNQIVAFIADTVVALTVLGFAVAVIAWFAGPFTSSIRLRGAIGAGLDATRRFGDRFNLSTGPVGRWLDRQRVLLRVLIALGAAAIILFVRPISSGLIIWTAVLALVLVLIVELLRRPSPDAVVVLEAVS